jgi:hypothetical protein
MESLAVMVHAQGNLDEALSIQKDILETRKKLVDDGHPETLFAKLTYVRMLFDKVYRIDEAVSCLMRFWKR